MSEDLLEVLRATLDYHFFEKNTCKEGHSKDIIAGNEVKSSGKKIKFTQPFQKNFYYFGVSTILDFY